MSLRVGLVGAGIAGASHALDIVTDPRLELVAVASRNGSSANALAETFGGRTFNTAGQMLAEARLDAVVVAVPPSAVLDIAELVPPRTPCLVEKPIATNPRELIRLQSLISSHPLMVAPFNRRYQVHVRDGADAVADGAIGQVRRIVGKWVGPYRARYAADVPTYRGTAGQRCGVLVDSGSHALDLVAMFIPSWTFTPGVVTGMKSLTERNVRGAEVEAELRFHIGGVEIELSFTDQPEHPDCGGWHMTVVGGAGTVTVDPDRTVIESTVRTTVVEAFGMPRPSTDLWRLADAEIPTGASLRAVSAVSAAVIAAYDYDQPRVRRWRRPRGKALGRLNGSC
ncbi:Gfo/Idh/MocA family protein [Nocardia sp. NPDC003183]